MDELIIETGPSPHLIIESQGKLYIKGWDKAEVRASTSGKDKLKLSKNGDEVTVHSLSNCEMRVPFESNIFIQAAFGEAILKSVTGPITIQQASAGLTLNDVGPTLVESIDRDLNAREIHGDLTVRQAARFVNASHVAGNFTGESIASHLNLKRVQGNISAHVLGNATLSLDPKPGTTCTVEAHGVLTCRIPLNTNATIQITGHGPIVTKIGGETTTLLDHTHTLTLGDGSATLALTAYGPISLLESDPDHSFDTFSFEIDKDLEMDADVLIPLSQQITQNVHEQIAMQMGMLEAQMDALVDTAGLSKEKADHIRARTQEKIARAQEKIARAQERASQKIESARRQAERETERSARRSSGYVPDAAQMSVREGLAAAREAVSATFGSVKRSSQTDPVSDQERMMILNMVAEKKINIEQAETLLAALEGR